MKSWLRDVGWVAQVWQTEGCWFDPWVLIMCGRVPEKDI